MRTFRGFIAAAILCAAIMPVQAQTHAELESLVQQLQANPTDAALRERVIAVARDLKPAPAIPEEARRHFVQGTTLAKAATDAAGQKLAVESFKEALKVAPWWGDAWYNLAVAQELAGQLDDARDSLKSYLLTSPGETEARDAQDRLYALEAKEKLAAAAAADAAAKEAAQREALLRSLDGARFVYEGTVKYEDQAGLRDIVAWTRTLEIRGRTASLSFSHRFPPPQRDEFPETCQLNGLTCVVKQQRMCCGIGTCELSVTIDETGQKAAYDEWCTGGKHPTHQVLRRLY